MTTCNDLKIADHLIKAVLDSFVPLHAPSSHPVYISAEIGFLPHQDQNVLPDIGINTNDLMGITDLV